MDENTATKDRLQEWIEHPDAYRRDDESDDRLFYQKPRFTQHLDDNALSMVSELIDALNLKEQPSVLDLMASIDTHLPEYLNPGKVVGLGMNLEEMSVNARLDDRIVQDLNADPKLPFRDNTFDLVLNVASIQYLTRPLEVFREVNRVLKPGGLFLVVFSARTFPSKAVNIWKQLVEAERLDLLDLYFNKAGGFTIPDRFMSMGHARPEQDKHADTGIPSDPIYAVYAEKGDPSIHADRRKAPAGEPEVPEPEILERRKMEFLETGACPYCGHKMRLWAITQNPMTTWDHDFYVCINDECPYLVRGWKVMYDQGNPGVSYRLSFDPVSKTFSPITIPSLNAIKSQLTDETWPPDESSD